MSIKVDTVTGPAFLASALVNGDQSGLTTAEVITLNRFVVSIAPARVVDVAREENGDAQEPRFTRSYLLHGGDYSSGDVLDYVTYEVIP